MFIIAVNSSLAWLTFFFSIGTSKSDETEKEIVVHINDSVTLDCKLEGFDHWPTWKFTPVGKNEADELNVAENIRSYLTARYYVLESKTRLVITSVDEGHAGRYACYDDQEVEVGLSAELHVVGSDPVCEGNVSSSGLEIQIVCLISSYGNLNFAKRCYSPVSSETLTFEPKRISGSAIFKYSSNISSYICEFWIQTKNCEQPNSNCTFRRQIRLEFSPSAETVTINRLVTNATAAAAIGRSVTVAVTLPTAFIFWFVRWYFTSLQV